MGAPSRDLRPQYGWNPYVFTDNNTLGEPGGLLPSETEAYVRPNGMYRVTVAGRVEAGAGGGAGTYGFVLEGSNTGGAAADEWIVLAETNLAEIYEAPKASLQTRVLAFANGKSSGQGFNGEATVPCDRWRYLRVRTFVSTGVPTFEIDIRMTGIAADGERNDLDLSLVRVSGDTDEPVTSVIQRPSGVRYLSAQAYVDAMIISPAPPAASFTLILETAQDQDAVDNDRWVPFDQLGEFDAVGDTGFFQNGQARLIDLSGWMFFRFRGEKTSGKLPDDISSYTISCLSTFDDADWIDGEQGIPLLHESIRKTFVMLAFDPAIDLGGGNWSVRLQLCDMNQTPIREVREVGILLAASEDGFSDDLSATATFTAALSGSIQYGAGNNVAVVRTENDGTMEISFADGGAVALFVAGWNVFLPATPSNENFGPGQILIATDRCTVI